jgi:hypothetical protein
LSRADSESLELKAVGLLQAAQRIEHLAFQLRDLAGEAKTLGLRLRCGQRPETL